DHRSSSVLHVPFGGPLDRAAAKRLGDDPLEPFAVQPEDPRGGVCNDGGVAGGVREQRDVSEVLAGAEGCHDLALADHIDPTGSEGVESVAGLPLPDTHTAGW